MMSLSVLFYMFFTFFFYISGVGSAGFLAMKTQNVNPLSILIPISLFAMMPLLLLHWSKNQVEYESYEEIPRRHRRPLEPIDPPTRAQLIELKETLGLDAGSLQYKARGRGIYNVVYREQRHVWTHIGSWCELKGKLEG